ncbi:hypothetical protein ACLMJK_007770 [Lecanora helva]
MPRGRAAKKGAGSQKPKNLSQKDVPDVYREMLADAASSLPTSTDQGGRAVKRRRVGGQVVTQDKNIAASHHSDQDSRHGGDSDLDELFEDVKPNPQSIVQTDSEDSADSDLNWEEVQLGNDASQEDTPESGGEENDNLNLVLPDENHAARRPASGKVKRKPMTAEDRKLRLEIHKLHRIIRKLLTRKMISYLNPDEDKSQFQRSRSFMDGLSQASEAFRGSFKITARGMGRSRWADSSETLALLQPPADIDLPMQITDFRDSSHQLQGSRDVGAQLFCAMLRSAGVDARLICSLQPLPFQPSQKVELSQVQNRSRHLSQSRDQDGSKTDGQNDLLIDPSSSKHATAANKRRSVSPQVEMLSSRKQRKPPRESKYPVYWVEAFNEAVQKWVPVDPLVTKTIAKPSRFEPPAGESENNMTYVIGFEDEGSARDVTRRYVKAYNAKTRRERVEFTSGGERWWRKVLKMYRGRYQMDRDQLEDAELANKEAAEPMPRNVQDFKEHPYYALERHLRRHEAIHPRREVGKVGTGRAGNIGALEPIFRRRDVHMVKSADKWYRLGREIKSGEQPLKRVAARRNRQHSLDVDDHEATDEDNAGTALYAAYQTTQYSAPPVVNGMIPKNAYGNLDIYVPSMVPPGGTHISNPETAKAVKIIGVDYADAITGFSFKGRHGTAIVKGAVVANEYQEAIEEVLKAFEHDRARAEEERRSLEVLRMWKKLLAGLRVRERIAGYEVEGERHEVVKEEMERVDEEDGEEEEGGGGFLPDRDANDDIQPTAGRVFDPHSLANLLGEGGGGFMPTEAEEDPGTREEIAVPRLEDSVQSDAESIGGGGFLDNEGDTDGEEALRDAQVHEHTPLTPTKLTRSRDSAIPIIREPVAQVDVRGPIDQGMANDEGADSAKDTIDEASSPDKMGDNEPAHLQRHEEPLDSSYAGPLNEELEDARMLQHLHDTSNMPSTSVTDYVDAVPTEGDGEHHDSISPSQEAVVDTDGDEHGSPESDRGSLLSHDPEDEDADPEWLA